MILFLSFLTVSVFGGLVGLLPKLFFIRVFFVWVRCCFPRYRYDLLIYSAWKILLPFRLTILVLIRILFY
jgi:NADH:ubiquinone oxidoreductase subunit H